MKLALKIDVDTYRGTREGVPRLVEALKRHNAGATFLFSLGPDHTGRAIRRVFRRGFLQKVSRTSVVEHYGYRTLMYGTLLPGPDIGRRCAAILRGVRDEGYEVGVHTYDHIKWQDYVAGEDGDWTRHEMHKAMARFKDIFDDSALTHGAAGWQMNAHAYRYERHCALDYASDGRGTHPFLPVVEGEVVSVPQLPTTLPTLDELIGVDGLDDSNVHERLLSLTAMPSAHDHVYTLHAELEGMKLLPVFERLLAGWQKQGYELVATRDIFRTLDMQALPRHEVIMAEIPGRSGVLACQGRAIQAPA